jgi:hypothetical protein
MKKVIEEDHLLSTDKKITKCIFFHLCKLTENGGATYVSEAMALGWCRHIPKATGGNTRNKMQRFCDIDEKRSNKSGLSITPCRARNRDIPQQVWTALGLSGRPHRDARDRHACGWVVCPLSTPIELLRWYERDNEDDPFIQILIGEIIRPKPVKRPRVMASKVKSEVEDWLLSLPDVSPVEEIDPVDEILKRYSSPGLKRNIFSRYAKAWHLRENYRMTTQEREALLDELYKE